MEHGPDDNFISGRLSVPPQGLLAGCWPVLRALLLMHLEVQHSSSVVAHVRAKWVRLPGNAGSCSEKG